MTVYKYSFISFIRNIKFFLIWMGIFTAITVFMVGSPSDTKEMFEHPRMSVALSKEITSDAMVNLTKGLEDSILFTPIDNHVYSAKEAVFLNGINLAIIKDPSTGKLIGYSNPSDINGYSAQSKIQSYLNFLAITEMDGKAQSDIARKIAKISIQPKILEKKSQYNYKAEWYYYTFQFLVYPLMGTIMSIIGIGIISFKNKNTQDRTKITSTSILKIKSQSLMAQFLSMLLILVLSLLIIFAIGGKGDVPYVAHITNLLAISISALGMIFLVTQISRHKNFVSSFANLFPLCLSFISGIFVDPELLPTVATSLARFFPMFYYYRGNQLARDGFSSSLFLYIGIQVLFGICYFLLAVLLEKISYRRTYAQH